MEPEEALWPAGQCGVLGKPTCAWHLERGAVSQGHALEPGI